MRLVVFQVPCYLVSRFILTSVYVLITKAFIFLNVSKGKMDTERLINSSGDELSNLSSKSESEGDITLDCIRVWIAVSTSSASAPPRFPFTGNPGVKVRINSDDISDEAFILNFLRRLGQSENP